MAYIPVQGTLSVNFLAYIHVHVTRPPGKYSFEQSIDHPSSNATAMPGLSPQVLIEVLKPHSEY